MEIKQEKHDTTLRLTLIGRLDTTTAPELQAVVQSSLENVAKLELDFAAVEYISSAGLRVLLMAQKCMAKQGKMELFHVNELVMQILDMSGFSKILTVVR